MELCKDGFRFGAERGHQTLGWGPNSISNTCCRSRMRMVLVMNQTRRVFTLSSLWPSYQCQKAAERASLNGPETLAGICAVETCSWWMTAMLGLRLWGR